MTAFVGDVFSRPEHTKALSHDASWLQPVRVSKDIAVSAMAFMFIFIKSLSLRFQSEKVLKAI